jgi:DNA-binding LytR/AlgR family response regulator
MSEYRILIVEDEASISESLEDLLELLGHQVVGIADTGEEALIKLKETKPDLVLLDIQLKGKMDGVDLAHLIKETYHLPFIFTTAFADDQIIARARAEGPYGYLVKPYGLKDIKAAIEIALYNFEAQQKTTSSSNEADPVTNADSQLYLKVDQRLIRVKPSEIAYVEAKGDYMLFRLTSKDSLIVHTTLKKVLEKLPPSKFLHVHRSFVINLDQICDIEDNTLNVLGKLIPVSRSKRTELLDRIKTI